MKLQRPAHRLAAGFANTTNETSLTPPPDLCKEPDAIVLTSIRNVTSGNLRPSTLLAGIRTAGIAGMLHPRHCGNVTSAASRECDFRGIVGMRLPRHAERPENVPEAGLCVLLVLCGFACVVCFFLVLCACFVSLACAPLSVGEKSLKGLQPINTWPYGEGGSNGPGDLALCASPWVSGGIISQ